MTTLDPASLVRELYEAFNEKRLARALAITAPEMRVSVVPFGVAVSMQDHFQNWATAFPDGVLEVTQLVAQEDGAAVAFTGRGTHLGPLIGPDGTRLPATGRRVEQRFVDMHELRGGRIVATRMYFDLASLLAQLKAAPQRVGEAADASLPGGDAWH